MPVGMQCPLCVHLRGGMTCEAFPRGIPESIATGLVSHTVPVRGDHGILSEPGDLPDDFPVRVGVRPGLWRRLRLRFIGPGRPGFG